MKLIYTIGHSSHDNIYFLGLLRKYNINCIVDIRSVPFSKYVPHFNKNVIKKFLDSNNINYVYMADEFGAIREDKNLFNQKGYLDFEIIKHTKSFKDGIVRINTGIDKQFVICLMCTEKDPLDCHRSIMIAPELVKNEFMVNHILPDGSIETQQELEKRLLQLYFPTHIQQDLFSTIEKNIEKDLLEKAYRLRNSDIGHRSK
jgi:uncharacterized protein (DUF488 family)